MKLPQWLPFARVDKCLISLRKVAFSRVWLPKLPFSDGLTDWARFFQAGAALTSGGFSNAEAGNRCVRPSLQGRERRERDGGKAIAIARDAPSDRIEKGKKVENRTTPA